MKQEVLKAFDLPWLPISALVLFVVCFSLYTWWTFRQKNKKFYEDISLIPLEDKESV